MILDRLLAVVEAAPMAALYPVVVGAGISAAEDSGQDTGSEMRVSWLPADHASLMVTLRCLCHSCTLITRLPLPIPIHTPRPNPCLTQLHFRLFHPSHL